MEYTPESIKEIVGRQRAFFLSDATLDLNFRKDQLLKLKKAVIDNEKELTDALSADLGRTEAEGFLCDVGPVILEINETIKGLKKWARPENHRSGLLCFPSMRTKVYKMPYGVSLIISPFNFPVMLTLGPLAAAVAGGNTAVIKASSKSPACTALLKKIIAETFPEEYITVIDGGHDVADMCLEQRFDKIFYTGSPNVAKHVLSEASKNLTPVALELGGETGNWAVVRSDADLRDTARKIAFFKICNSGQICININQIAVEKSVADTFVKELCTAFEKQIGRAIENDEYPHLINRRAYDKCAAEAELYRERIVYGGEGNPETLKYSPTVIYPVDIDEPIVNHELFCPLLPVVVFNDGEVESVLETVQKREHPLAFYVFTSDISWAKKTMQRIQFGGGCINEVCIHLMVKGVPFNGTGHSGMGAYHGVWGFREFTHPQTVLIGKKHFNLSLREHPYGGKSGKLKMRLLHLFEK